MPTQSTSGLINTVYQWWMDGVVGFADFPMDGRMPTLDTIVIADVEGREVRFRLGDLQLH
jgi:hypothetical protein